MRNSERDVEASAVCKMLDAVLLQDAEPSQQFIDEHPAVKVLMRLKCENAELRLDKACLEGMLHVLEAEIRALKARAKASVVVSVDWGVRSDRAVWACTCGERTDTAGAMAAHLKDAHGKA